MTQTAKTIKQIDAELATLHGELTTVQRAITRNTDDAHHMVRDYKIGRGRNARWQLDDSIVFDALEARLEDPKCLAWIKKDIDRCLTQRMKLDNRRMGLIAQIGEYDAKYDANPWSRFFVVTSSAGHIHSSMECQTCNPATTYRWLPELSGDTEEAAVRAHGPNLCSVCFPSAPLAWTVGSKASKPRCAGTSQLALDITWVGDRRYGTCRGCGERHQVNSNGKPRAHK